MEINGRKFVEYQAHSGANAAIRTIPHTLDFAAVCLTCGAARAVERDKLREHGDLTLREVSPMLRCQTCDRKHARLITGYFTAGQ